MRIASVSHSTSEAITLSTQFFDESWIARMGRCDIFHTTEGLIVNSQNLVWDAKEGEHGSQILAIRVAQVQPKALKVEGSQCGWGNNSTEIVLFVALYCACVRVPQCVRGMTSRGPRRSRTRTYRDTCRRWRCSTCSVSSRTSPPYTRRRCRCQCYS